MRARLDHLMTLALFGLSICLVALVVAAMRYGFDFTDEAYYLVWMKNPLDYDFSVSQSGFIYFPLFHGVSQDVHLVRIANIALTYALASILSFFAIKAASSNIGSGLLRVALAFALATTGTIFLFWLPPTPSYNTLAFQALMITAIGQLHAGREMSKANLSGWVLIGIGGWLTFMAKPSAAAALAPVVLVITVLSGKFSLRGVAVALAVAGALLVAGALSIDGSLDGFRNRIAVALRISALAGAGYTIGDILRWDSLSFVARDKQVALVTVGFLLLAGAVFRRKPSALVAGMIVAILLVCCGVAVALALRWIPPDVASGVAARAVLLAFPLASLIVASPALVETVRAPRDGRGIPGNLRGNYVTGLGFCVMPLVYAFGSNNNYWYLGGDAGLFWVLAGVLFAAPATDGCASLRRFAPFALAAPVLSLFYFQHGQAQPYRQPQPLWLNDQTVQLGKPPSTLVLSGGYAAYIREARQGAQQAAFEAGTPVIDLSGQSPGILFAIGARNAGYPWLSGGYPGSVAVVRAALARVSCADLARAWLLLERGGPRAIDNAVLSVFDADVDADFAVAAEWHTAAGAGGYRERRAQQLLRPTRSESAAMSACIAARAEVK